MERITEKYNVIVIGGCSATGKTFVSKYLSEKFGYKIIKVDDIRFFMQHILDEESFPFFFELFSFKPESILNSPIELLLNSYIKIGQFLAPGINSLIDKYASKENAKVVIEGIDIYPKFLEINHLANVKPIFLFDDLENLVERNRKRKRSNFPDEYYAKESEVQFELGKIIAKQAKESNMTTIKSSPIQTLCERVALEIQK